MSARTTQDHGEIRKWVEEHGGIPTIVDGTGGVLRIDFLGNGREERLCETDWQKWFEVFEDRGLTFLHGEGESRFHKLIYADDSDGGGNGASGSGKSSRAEDRVAINEASEEDLDSLFGVGPAMAKRIIQHRQKNGPFRSADELKEIEGVDGSMVSMLAPNLEFD